MLKQGLYEQVVNTEIKDELRQLPENSKHVEKIDTAESSSPKSFTKVLTALRVTIFLRS